MCAINYSTVDHHSRRLTSRTDLLPAAIDFLKEGGYIMVDQTAELSCIKTLRKWNEQLNDACFTFGDA